MNLLMGKGSRLLSVQSRVPCTLVPVIKSARLRGGERIRVFKGIPFEYRILEVGRTLTMSRAPLTTPSGELDFNLSKVVIKYSNYK